MTNCNLTKYEACSEAEIGHAALPGTESVIVLEDRANYGKIDLGV